jgi:hypothetical protein
LAHPALVVLLPALQMVNWPIKKFSLRTFRSKLSLQ